MAVAVRDGKVRAAAMWLSEQDPVPAHVVNLLKTKFSLKALEVCEACRLAQSYRTPKGTH